MARLNLSPPWYTYYTELCMLFGQDPEIHIIYDEDEQTIKFYVENDIKAEALTCVLPYTKDYGNVTLKIEIVPANKLLKVKTTGDTFKDLFTNNPIVDDVVIIDNIFVNPITYVIFKKEVVQYFNDDLGDANGFCSTLYQDIAKRVLEPNDGVYYCTSLTNDEGFVKIGTDKIF